MTKLCKTINILLVAGILSIGLLLLGTMMPIPGNFKVKIVKSGSMEPAIRTGGIVVIKPESEYKVGDVVTFGKDTKTQIPTTHRIVEIGDSKFGSSIRTKGDANNSEDPTPTSLKEVSGKVIFTMPYVGYLLDFARKPIGFALLVGLPAFAIIVDEVGKIMSELRRLRRKKNGGESKGNDNSIEFIVSLDALPKKEEVLTQEIHTRRIPRIGLTEWQPKKIEVKEISPVRAYDIRGGEKKECGVLVFKSLLALLAPAILFVGSASEGNTVSYYSDIETSVANFLKADPLGFTVRALGSSQLDMSSGSRFITTVITPNQDSEPIQYSLSTTITGGDMTLCSLLQVESTTTTAYAGSMLLLSTSMSTSTGEIPLLFTLPSGYTALPNTSCFVDFVFVGRNADAQAGEGYSDIKKLSLQFYIPAEILPVAPLLIEPLPETIIASDTPEEVVIVEPESTTTLPATSNADTDVVKVSLPPSPPPPEPESGGVAPLPASAPEEAPPLETTPPEQVPSPPVDEVVLPVLPPELPTTPEVINTQVVEVPPGI